MIRKIVVGTVALGVAGVVGLGTPHTNGPSLTLKARPAGPSLTLPAPHRGGPSLTGPSLTGPSLTGPSLTDTV